MEVAIEKITARVREYMGNDEHDASHDWSHIQRVLALASFIKDSERKAQSTQALYSDDVITLSALLHDVSDRKYSKSLTLNGVAQSHAGDDIVRILLAESGVPDRISQSVHTIVSCVSYSVEIQDPEAIRSALSLLPELAVVQDADRLDALGATGIGRAFTYAAAVASRTCKINGVNSGRSDNISASVVHFEEKLVKLESMMKTETGKKLAAERTRRIHSFLQWWKEEQALES